MQVHQHRQEVVDEENMSHILLQQGEDLPIEGFIFPQLIRKEAAEI